jgi:RNA polymerase sigma factor (sigma-70 family)
MDQNSAGRGVELERLRPYLHLIARIQLDYRLRSLIDPDDVVNDVFCKALENWDQCTGSRKAWLRRILLNHLTDLIKKHVPKVALREELERSSLRLEAILVADQSRPSRRAERNEDLARLAEALAMLPIKEQEAVILIRLHLMKLKDAAAQLGMTPGAVTGFLYRGLERLVRHLTFPE